MDIKQKIEAANAEAARRINAGDPVLLDIAPAGEVIPGLKDRMILHSGPPVDWAHMCGAQRENHGCRAALQEIRDAPPRFIRFTAVIPDETSHPAAGRIAGQLGAHGGRPESEIHHPAVRISGGTTRLRIETTRAAHRREKSIRDPGEYGAQQGDRRL